MRDGVKNKVLSGFSWTFAERLISQGVSFVVSIVLARIVSPDEYGIVALLLVFINIANVFVTNGFGEALVQKKDADELDFSTIFYCGLGVSIGLYILLFFAAPFIASFYDNDKLTLILRIFSLRIPLSAINTVQHAYVSKHMIFKKFFFSTLGGTFISGVIGIFIAMKGGGAWALVAQYMTLSIVDTIVLFLIVDWKPKAFFSKERAKRLMSFGWKIMLSNLINNIYSNLRSLIIGKVYTTADLSYYNKGDQFPNLIITNINTAIGNVIFPAMSEVQSDIDRLKQLTRRSMKTTSYIIFPCMVGLIVIAKPLILLLLTDKWLDCVPYLQICCVFWVFQPMQTANWQAIKAIGRSDLCVKLEVIKKIIGITMLLCTLNISVAAMAWSNAIFGGISMLINMMPNIRLLKYPIREQFKDLLPSLGLSVVMGMFAYSIRLFGFSAVLEIVLQIVVSIIVYLGLSHFFKVESYTYLKNTLKGILEKKNK